MTAQDFWILILWAGGAMSVVGIFFAHRIVKKSEPNIDNMNKVFVAIAVVCVGIIISIVGLSQL